MNHWLIAPVVLPLFAGALLVLLEKARSRATAGVSLGRCTWWATGRPRGGWHWRWTGWPP